MQKKSYHIITIGCQMNKTDSERLAAFLENEGYKEQADITKAALVLINTCGIRQSAEDRLYGLVNQIKKKNPKCKVVVTGCLSKREDVHKRLVERVDLFIPINEMQNILKILEQQDVKNRLTFENIRELQGEKYLSIIPKYQSKFSAFVPIGNGCNNFCSYCVVPYARGREVYRPADDILKEVRNLISKGYKEINLIAQNVNSYNDKKNNFPALLRKVCKIPGDFWIRFSSSHPKDVSDELIETIAKNKKICPHLHLAVQSGDDKILEVMNRKYTSAHFIEIINKLRALRPEISITTDVIVGFPGETKAQYLNTVKLFKKINFHMAYISRYSPRPGTVSYNMKDNVSSDEKKRREFDLDSVLKKGVAKINSMLIGTEERVLIEGINKKNKYYGKTASFKVFLAPAKEKNAKSKIGSFSTLKIIKIAKFGLEGEILN